MDMEAVGLAVEEIRLTIHLRRTPHSRRAKPNVEGQISVETKVGNQDSGLVYLVEALLAMSRVDEEGENGKAQTARRMLEPSEILVPARCLIGLEQQGVLEGNLLMRLRKIHTLVPDLEERVIDNQLHS